MRNPYTVVSLSSIYSILLFLSHTPLPSSSSKSSPTCYDDSKESARAPGGDGSVMMLHGSALPQPAEN